MDNAELTMKAKAVFGSDRFAVHTTGVSLQVAMDHGAICELAIDRRHLNARRIVMGGAIYTLADFAAAVAANTDQVAAEQPLAWVSLNATINYLGSTISCDTLRAECKAIKHGRTTALYHTVITDPENDRTIAIAETTMIHV